MPKNKYEAMSDQQLLKSAVKLARLMLRLMLIAEGKGGATPKQIKILSKVENGTATAAERKSFDQLLNDIDERVKQW